MTLIFGAGDSYIMVWVGAEKLLIEAAKKVFKKVVDNEVGLSIFVNPPARDLRIRSFCGEYELGVVAYTG